MQQLSIPAPTSSISRRFARVLTVRRVKSLSHLSVSECAAYKANQKDCQAEAIAAVPIKVAM
eukprot:6206763-Pleurochrysis_carterae.AAC.10